MNSPSIATPSAAAAFARCSAPGLLRLPAMLLPALLCGALGAAPAWPDVPDNRGVRLDPEDQVSQTYRDSLDERDHQRREEAYEHGSSFIATVQGTGRVPGENLPEARPHEGEGGGTAGTLPEPHAGGVRLRPVYESSIRQQTPGTAGNPGLEAMVGVLLESWTRPPSMVHLRYAASRDRGGDAARSSTVPEPAGPDHDRVRLPHVAAGQGFYARTLYAVDSGYPGPVVLELLQPPLAGAVAHGGFERVGTRLVLRLTSLTWRGRTVPVDAWAVDPECACYGVRGEVDRHFMARVVLPAAARFAEGFMTALAIPARTLTLQDGAVLQERDAVGGREAVYTGLGEASRSLGDILMADAPRETTVRIPRDTPLVVMVAHPIAWPPEASADPGAMERFDAGN